MFSFCFHYIIAYAGVQTILHGTILHLATELGSRAVGGAGTALDELRRVSGPSVGFVCLGPDAEPADDSNACPHGSNVIYADFYEMDVLNRLAFDIAVFHDYSLAYLADDSFLRGRPLVFVVHSVPTTEPWSLLDPYGGHAGIARAFERMCDTARWIVCVSEAERGKLLLLYPDLKPKTCVIRNGFSAFAYQPIRIRPRRTAFGFLGRADARKGLLELVRAFAAVPGTLRIACGEEDAEYAQSVRDNIGRLQLGGRAFWEGRIHPTDKLAYLRSLDALVVPSLWEPFGYVALEALRAGVPPLVSRQGGIHEIVGPDYPYAFDPWNESSIAACLRAFQNDPPERVRAAVEQARRYAAPLTAERMAEVYEALPRVPAVAGLGVTPRGKRYAAHGSAPPPVPGQASVTPKALGASPANE